MHLSVVAINALACAVLAVLLLEKLTEDAEGDRRLGGRAGFRDDVDAHVASLADAEKVCKCGCAYGVSGEVNVGGVLL